MAVSTPGRPKCECSRPTGQGGRRPKGAPMSRVEVELGKAYRRLNHGPTVLVSAQHGGVHNVMAAAWNMPLDFTPPKVAVVIDKSTFTRGLIEASGRFTLSVPCRAQAALVTRIGGCSGREIDKATMLEGLA